MTFAPLLYPCCQHCLIHPETQRCADNGAHVAPCMEDLKCPGAWSTPQTDPQTYLPNQEPTDMPGN